MSKENIKKCNSLDKDCKTLKKAEKALETAQGYETEKLNSKKEELDERLASVIIQFKARPGQFVLMADPQAPAGEMIYLVDAVRQHGGEKLHVATSPRVEK